MSRRVQMLNCEAGTELFRHTPFRKAIQSLDNTAWLLQAGWQMIWRWCYWNPLCLLRVWSLAAQNRKVERNVPKISQAFTDCWTKRDRGWIHKARNRSRKQIISSASQIAECQISHGLMCWDCAKNQKVIFTGSSVLRAQA